MFFSDNDTTFLDEIKEILPVAADTSRTRLWPFLEQAERKYILPLLGRASFDDLDTYYNDHDNWNPGSGSGDTADEEKTAELLRLVQISVVNLAYFIGFDVLNTVMGAQGFQRTENDTFKGLYKYQEGNIKDYFANTGFNGLDDILAYLEEYAEYFPEWEESDTYTALHNAIIKDTATFNTIINIKSSRLIFLRMQSFFDQTMDIDIIPVLGSTIWAALQAELVKDDPAAAYAALAVQLRKPLAYLAAAYSVQYTGDLTDRGLYFEGKNSLFPDDRTIQPAKGSEAAERYTAYRVIGERYLAGLRKYLVDNSFDDYDPDTNSVYSRDNDDKLAFFV